MKKILLSVGYMLTIPAANWMIGNVGTQFDPHGPHTLPVGFGLAAPSGVLMIGVALVLRDFLTEHVGWKWMVTVILGGAGLSFLVAVPSLAVASGVAFALGELADWFVYRPIREHHRPAAVLASGLVGAVVDSALFLWLAFGSVDFLAGNVVGKVWMSLGVAAVLAVLRARSRRR